MQSDPVHTVEKEKKSAFNRSETGAAGSRTEPPGAAEHSPAQPSPSSISFPAFLGRAPSLPSPPPARSLAPFWLLSRSWRSCGPQQRGGQGWRLGPRSPQAPFFLWVPSPALPRELTRLCWGGGRRGGSGFSLRRSQEHYGRARSRLGRQPQPPESGAGTGGGRERGSASWEARARSPRPDRRRSHGRAPRLRPEDQQVNLGRGTRRRCRGEERGSPPAPGLGGGWVWRRGRRDPAACPAAGRRGWRLRPRAALGSRPAASPAPGPREPGAPASTSAGPRAPGPGVSLRLTDGRAGGGSSSAGRLVGGASQILCVPTPGAGKAAALRPLALPAHSPCAPRRARAAALLSPPRQKERRARAGLGPGEAAPPSRLLPFLGDLTGTLLAPRGPIQSGLLHPGLMATMES